MPSLCLPFSLAIFLSERKLRIFTERGSALHFGEYIFNEVLMIFTETMKRRTEGNMLNKTRSWQGENIRSLGLQCTGGKIAIRLAGSFL